MSEVSQLISERVEASDSLSDEAKLLVLAAVEGDASLADLAGFVPPSSAPAEVSCAEPAGAFLSAISVAGFRGIGPEATLSLRPGPGLTVVAGRNGSGKSSVAEALELALTRTTYRWKGKPSVLWSNGWRNLHDGADPRITVKLAEEGRGETWIRVTWPQEAEDVATADVRLQRKGQKQEASLEGLGWTAALETYRPMLSYEELGALLVAEPSRLYDALSNVLGLEEIGDAIKRLDAHCKSLRAPEVAVREHKRSLVADLAASDDVRAIRARKLVSSSKPDIEALRSLATGGPGGDRDEVDGLNRLLHLSLPDGEVVTEAAKRLRAAVQAMSRAGDEHLETLQLRRQVWEAAVSLHDRAGDESCPVCGQGHLDAVVVDDLRRQLHDVDEHLVNLHAASTELRQARETATRLITPLPECTRLDLPESLRPARDGVVEAWHEWSTLPDDDLDLAEHLEHMSQLLRESLTRLQQAVSAELRERDAAWTPLAARVAAHAERLAAWTQAKPEADEAKHALRWLKDNDIAIKNDRIRPIADRATEIWNMLRRHSNVDFTGLTLAGTTTRRRVDILSSVDDQPGAGLAVLSQGELHALALALFLPRATLPESPFRFVILDDPVQAMDPAKVDGLVEVLAEIARTRQVIVFSHDDRLAAAVRRGTVDATIVEVTRGEGSVVTFEVSQDPAARYLSDAFGMARDPKLPIETLRRLLPSMLRFAVEAQARDRYFNERLRSGDSHADLEDAWNSAHTTSRRLALGLYGEDRSLDAWLARRGERSFVLGVCSSGVHQGLRGDPMDACRATERVLEDVKAGR